MKILSYAGLGLGLIATGIALYLLFVIVPEANAADTAIQLNIENSAMEGTDDIMEYRALVEQRGKKVDYGIMVLFTGGLAFLVSIYPAVKKDKYAIIGVGLGIVTFLIGAAYGTHMFS